MSDDQSISRKPITDSPWFWIYLFCTVGLVLLVVSERKLVDMMVSDANKAEGRQRAWQQRSEEKQAAMMEFAFVQESKERTARNTLRVLYVNLAVILAVAWVILWYRRFRRRQQHEPAPKQRAAI